MATIILTIPDAQLNRVVDGISGQYGYRAVLEDGQPNPETKAQFAKRMVVETVKAAVRSWEANQAAEAARIAAAAAVDQGVNIT